MKVNLKSAWNRTPTPLRWVAICLVVVAILRIFIYFYYAPLGSVEHRRDFHRKQTDFQSRCDANNIVGKRVEEAFPVFAGRPPSFRSVPKNSIHATRFNERRTVNQYWIALLVAAGLEVVWAIGLKHTEGFTRFWPSVGTVLAMVASMYLLARAAAGLPIGTAYAVWTGIGAVGTALLGILVLNESRDWVRLVCIGLIVMGVVGLKVFAKESSPPLTKGAVSHPAS